MNICTFSGNLGSDAKLAYSSSGSPYTKFDLGVSISRKRELSTMWVRCTAFGNTAETAIPRLTKGQRVVVSGRLITDTYTALDGKERTELQLAATAIETPQFTDARPKLAATIDAP
jgi:single-strand DNA-binding protein